MTNKVVKADYSVLKKFSQKTDKGDIFERDIMTINPMEDLFTKGQDVVFSDTNFKFSVRTDKDKPKKHVKNSWIKTSGGSEIWLLSDVDTSPVSSESEIRLKPNYNSVKDFAYYGSAVELIKSTLNHIIQYFPAELYFSDEKFKYDESYYVIPNGFEINVDVDFVDVNKIINPYRYFCLHSSDYDVCSGNTVISNGVIRENFVKNENYKCGNGIVGTVTLETSLGNVTITVYVYDEEKYLLFNDASLIGYSLRPSNEIINEYYNTIDDFESILVNRDTMPLYKAVFETPYETDEGNKYEMKSYILPNLNEWNPDLESGAYSNYVVSLINLATFHDEYDSDIMWRVLTHEAIKNLDWTFIRDNNDVLDELNTIDTSKILPIIEIYGRQFDGLKRYIDAIKDSNNITYNEKNNLPNYLLTDAVENGGFDAILPNQTGKTDVLSDRLFSARTNGYSEVDANVCFMKILKINEPYLNSIKGTRNGIETILKLLGVKENEYQLREYVTVAKGGAERCDFSDDISFGDNFYPRAENVLYPSFKDVVSINVNKDENTIDDYNTFTDGIAVKPFRKMTDNESPTYYSIPWYENGKHYDGEWYFQSKGGWGKTRNKKVDNPVVEDGVSVLTDFSIYDETESYLKIADNIYDMLGMFADDVFKGCVCYVTDINSWPGSSGDDASHYFVLKNLDKISNIDNSGTTNNADGWRNVPISEIRQANTEDGKKVVYLENIIETTMGNNPHISNGEYDDGLDYLKYLNQIFRYHLLLGTEGLVRFSDEDKLKIKNSYVFNIETDPKKFVKDDWKCDYFYNPQVSSTTLEINGISVLDEKLTQGIHDGYTNGIPKQEGSLLNNGYAVNPEGGNVNEEPSANSIINIKNIQIAFIDKPIIEGKDTEVIKEDWQDYITNVVMNYVKQMLPSTTIFKWGFVSDVNNELEDYEEPKYLVISPTSANVTAEETQVTFNVDTNVDFNDITVEIVD